MTNGQAVQINQSDLNVVVVGVVRNVAKNLAIEVNKLASTLQHFNKVQWLVIESDSNDNTESVLKQLSVAKQNFYYQCLGKLDQTIPERTERIAFCRNAYLEELENNPRFQDSQLVIIADLDGINNIIDQSAIDSCFKRNDWDACFANTKGAYYDIWALRHPNWCPKDCLQEFKFLKQQGWGEYAARLEAIYAKMITIDPNSNWLEVDSAFAGLGIYKKHAIKGLRYQAWENNTAICEHILFHKGMRQRGSKLFINPKLLNCKNPPHTRKLRFPNSWLFKLKLLFSSQP